jgi:hypothetical protein
MKKFVLALSLLLVTSSLLAQQPTLYKRLGGYECPGRRDR